MIEKTPFQLMREKQQGIIEKQKRDAENRAMAYQKGIEFVNQQDLNEKTEALIQEKIRIAQKRQAIVEEIEQERKRKKQEKSRSTNNNSTSYDMNNANWTIDNTFYSSHSSYDSSSSSSSSHSSYSSCSSDSSSSSSSDSSSSSSSSCD